MLDYYARSASPGIGVRRAISSYQDTLPQLSDPGVEDLDPVACAGLFAFTRSLGACVGHEQRAESSSDIPGNLFPVCLGGCAPIVVSGQANRQGEQHEEQ